MVSSETYDYCDNVARENRVLLAGRPVGAIMLLIAICYFLSSVTVVYFIKRKEKEAQLDQYDSKASNSVIFPVFVDILWANAIINIYVGIILITLSYNTLLDENLWAYALMYGLQHLVTEGIAFMLMRKGVGWKAAKDSFFLALGWGVFTWVVKLGVGSKEWLPDPSNYDEVSFGLNIFWDFCLLVFYWTLWKAPKKVVFRRPAAIFYAKFWVIFRLLVIANEIITIIPQTSFFGKCFNVYGVLLPFSVMEPLVVYFTLLQDSRWWQGMSITTHIFSNDRASIDSNESGRNAINTPLHGVDLNLRSAQSLAAQVDAMSGGSRAIKLLNFSQIVLDKQHLLGSGSFSRVFKGSYRQKQCAVKLIYTLDITEDVIKRVAAEAQILSEIEHPNIVQIFGVSVLPPSVCILLELCHFGSLADVIGGGSSNKPAGVGALRLHLADKLFLAWGAAKGLAALHAWNPDLCHRDIKSFNFLVDAQMNAKLADLELGVTSTMRPPPDPDVKKNMFRVDSFNYDNDVENGINNISLQSDEILANWVAPEVLSGEAYKQYSDIYSFALVLWEILSGQHPFSDITCQDDIRSMVMEGHRPAMPDAVLDAGPPLNHYIALIERCWQHHPKMRPTAQEVLSELECIYNNVCHTLVIDTDVFPNISSADILKRKTKGLNIWSPNSDTNTNPMFLDTPDFSVSNLSSMNNFSAAVADVSKEMVYIDRFYEKVEAVIKDPSYKLIDRDTSAWLLVTSFAPHIVVRVSAYWSQLSGNNSCNLPASFERPSSVLGKPLASVLVGEKTDVSAWTQFATKLGSEADYESHTMATLHKERSSGGVFGASEDTLRNNGTYKPPSDPTVDPHTNVDSSNNNNNSSSKNVSKNVYGDDFSLFSVHAYPIRTRSAVTVSTTNSRASFLYNMPSSSDRDRDSFSTSLTNEILGETDGPIPDISVSSPSASSFRPSDAIFDNVTPVTAASDRDSFIRGDQRDSITIAVATSRLKAKEKEKSMFSSIMGGKKDDQQERRRPVVLYAILFSEVQPTSENLQRPVREEGALSSLIRDIQAHPLSNSRLKYSAASSNGSKHSVKSLK